MSVSILGQQERTTAMPVPCRVRQVRAIDLRIGDIVVTGLGAGRRGTTARVQGARPVVGIGYAGDTQPHHYPAGHLVVLIDRADA